MQSSRHTCSYVRASGVILNCVISSRPIPSSINKPGNTGVSEVFADFGKKEISRRADKMMTIASIDLVQKLLVFHQYKHTGNLL